MKSKINLSSESYIIAFVVIAIFISIIVTLVYVYISLFSPHSSSSTPGISTIPNTATPLPTPTFLNSSLFNDTIPSIMVPGQEYNVSIIAQNTGDVLWSNYTHIMISPSDDNSNDAQLFGNSSMITPGLLIKKGTNYTWTFSLIAPLLNGNYTLKYQMKNDSIHFGNILVKNVTIGNPGDVVKFISKPVLYYPSIMNQSSLSMSRNSWLNASITVKNTGRNNWTSADNVYLQAIDYEPNDAALFNPETVFYLAPDRIIVPGDQTTWTFKFHAMAQYPGTYHVKYRMIRNGQWFGNPFVITITET